jgi:hypothetical protein
MSNAISCGSLPRSVTVLSNSPDPLVHFKSGTKRKKDSASIQQISRVRPIIVICYQ